MSDINDISDKVKNMGKDENVMRVDVRVPLGIYERIEVLAEKTNQPFTPKTKKSANPKRIVTPIILKLVELGLKAIDEDSTNLDEDLVRKDIDNSESIENRLFVRLEARLEVLFEVKLDEILAKVKADTTITPEDTEAIITPEDNSESAIEPNETIEVSALEVTNNNSENEINPEDTEAKTFEDTENEIKKLSSQGLNYSQIAKKLIEGNYPTKKGSFKWVGNQVKRILEPKNS